MPIATRGTRIRAKLTHRNKMLELCGRSKESTLTRAENAWRSIWVEDRAKAVEKAKL